MPTKSHRENRDSSKLAAPVEPCYTRRQGQFLAFIYYYTKIQKCPPAEADIAAYFGISPPSAHQAILKLERQGLITRIPGRARSIRLTLPRESLPDLE